MFKKIFLSIIAVITILILSAVVTIIFFKAGVDKSHPNNELIMKSEESNGKEALIIYQNCRSEFPKEIAVSLATGLKNKDYNVTINTAGDFLPKDVSKYNVVILGGAVLAGDLGTPVQKYAKSIENFGDAKVFLYSTGAQLDNLIELDNLEKLLSKKPIQKIKFSYSDRENSKTKAVSLGEEFGNT